MTMFPDEPKKIKARIARYERALRKEQNQYGYISDGYGKRYLLGPLYMLLGDEIGAVRSFEWFEQTFPDEAGDLQDLVAQLFEDAGVQYERVNSRGEGYSVAESAIYEHIHWYDMLWEA